MDSTYNPIRTLSFRAETKLNGRIFKIRSDPGMSGCSKREAARIFKIGEASIYRWLKLYKAGSLKPKKRTDYPRKVDEQKLRDYVGQNLDHTLEQIGQALNLGLQTVSTWLNRLKIT